MIYFGLTELGNIVKLDVSEEIVSKNKYNIIEDAIVLDIDNSTFTIDYTSKHGDLVSDTLTENPKDIYDRLTKARVEIEKREVALMRNLFILDKDAYNIKPKKPRKPRIKKDITE